MMEVGDFERKDVYYNEKLQPVDEKICGLLKQRKELAEGNPGHPLKVLVKEWAEKYGFYEEYLHTVFSTLNLEDMYKPRVKPNEFRCQIPVMRSAEQDGVFYSVVAMRQYDNASVVVLSADWEEEFDLHHSERTHREFTLEIGGDQEYDCRMQIGSGTTGKMSYNYIISPALPDHLAEIEFRVRAYIGVGKENPVGPEFVLV
ncbi:hypothetical protein GCM10007362_08680 [Saccharibacillus endophyticus]|uniref:Uncharacterized protein n=2 Tax=Saccharibacillus endophyticus TaxID=2060666 RepID=A0ABQ1ZQW5_9BACL|nr:hypothetical protein GCM10007362_08680 [Saccharibacillus endophyticus]